jgi:hypothetical protein
MTINEAVIFIDAQARKNQVGNITIAQKNAYFKRAQLEIVNDLFGNIEEYQMGRPVPRKAFEVTSIISDDLSPLIKATDITQMASGIATKPSDFLYFINLESDYYTNPTTPGGTDAYQSWVQVDFVTHAEKASRMNSHIDYPDKFTPIAVNYSGYFQIYPDTIQKVRLTYLRKPLDPVWGYTTTNGAPVYNYAASQDFELPETVHTKICQKVLEYIGISTRDEELISVSDKKLKQGT